MSSLQEAHAEVQARYVAYLREKLSRLPEARIGEGFPRSREEWEAHCAALLPALRKVFDFPEADGPLNPRTVGRAERDDFVIEKVIYDAEPGSSVPAHLYLPKGVAFPVPALIFPSGHGGSKGTPFYNQYAGQIYAKAGLVCLIPDPVGEEERDEENRAGVRGHWLEFRVDRCYEVGRSVIGKMTYDIVRGIDYLCPAFAWVERHLGMPKFDAKGVAALPEVYLGDWADAKGVQIERGYRSHKHYAGTVVIDLGVEPIPMEELACLPPRGFRAPQFAMRGWVASVRAGLPPALHAPADLEGWEETRAGLRRSVAEVIALPHDRPAAPPETVRTFEGEGYAGEELRYGALGLSSFLLTPKRPTGEAAIYLHGSRTRQGALASEEVRGLLALGVTVLALDCVGMDDSGLLIGELSTAVNVQHVIESLDFLGQRGVRGATCFGYVDDVALYAAILDERIAGVTLGARGGVTPNPRQGYRQEGVVPYIHRYIGRPGLLALVAPRPLTLRVEEEGLEDVRRVYRLYGAEDRFKTAGE